MQQKKKFTGRLREPIDPWGSETFVIVESSTHRESVLRGKQIEKIPELAKHYQVADMDIRDAGKLLELTLRIAEDFVPGFRDAGGQRTGRPRKWDFIEQWNLVLWIHNLHSSKGLGPVQACGHLVRKVQAYAGMSRAGLYKQYQHTLRKLPVTIKFMQSAHAKFGFNLADEPLSNMLKRIEELKGVVGKKSKSN